MRGQRGTKYDQPWFDMDCCSIMRLAGFLRWKVVSGKYRLRIGSVRMEIQINTKLKPHDNSQKTTKIGHHDPLTSINI